MNSPAVFLSYAREDSAAAQRIADALRAFGVEVWFDQSELRGGDTWDQKIRTQIKTCALFVPIVSAQTEERTEGYFRREWLMAVERTRDMAAGRAFILPVVIDNTKEKEAVVPEEFMRYQWTRLEQAVPTPEFIAQVKRLLEPPKKSGSAPVTGSTTAPAPIPAVTPTLRLPLIFGGVAVLAVGLAIFAFLRPTAKEATTLETPAKPLAGAKPPAGVPAAPTEKSIAVLPFTNMSTEKENEFLADGIHEDVLTSLAKIRDLKVISRTSVLAYRDTASRNLKKIAADLGVAVVLEGSVRRSGNRVRVTAQLIDARTDEHLWAENYDGDTGDVFALQAKLAQQIAAALKATLTPGERSLIERRPTQDAQAYEFYQRALTLRLELDANTPRDKYETIISLLEQATTRDPAFTLAHGELVEINGLMYWFGAIDPTAERRDRARAALEQMDRRAPDAPETLKARGIFAYFCETDWAKALKEMSAAEASLPNDSALQNRLGTVHRRLGQWAEALRHFERAVALNPRDLNSITGWIETNAVMRRHAKALELSSHYLTLFPDAVWVIEFNLNARLALERDWDALLKARAAMPLFAWDSLGLVEAYRKAMREGDFAAADRALADQRLTHVRADGGAISEPAVLLRAELALLRGDAAAAQRHSADAIAALHAGRWSERQILLVELCLARARICAGEVDAGSRVMRETLERLARKDRFIMAANWREAARTFVAAGRMDDALDCLRRLFAGPSYASAEEIRREPYFAKLRSDPRFEQILQSAKPL